MSEIHNGKIFQYSAADQQDRDHLHVARHCYSQIGRKTLLFVDIG